jgi:hypothetical protein
MPHELNNRFTQLKPRIVSPPRDSLRPMHIVRIVAIPTARCLFLPKTPVVYMNAKDLRES